MVYHGWVSAAILCIIVGLLLLAWSAERFVHGAAALARSLNASPLAIGMLVVGFGTSAPELLVSAIAAADRQTSLAVGNAYGSNIFNIALVLGITSLIHPIAVTSRLLLRELPVLALVTLLALGQLADGELSRAEGLVLLSVFGVVMVWLWRLGRKEGTDPVAAETETEYAPSPARPLIALVWTLVGLVTLVVSSRVLVWGAESLARGLGVSELIVGLTIVAAGTSLPELASSVVAARKGELNLALGNVIGSNIFNTLAVVGVASVIHPQEMHRDVLLRDGMVMGGLTLFLFAIGYGFGRRGVINRYEGAILVLVYCTYAAWLLREVIG
ncbi:MAG: K+-dependent Na+/Ca+ exchanger [Fimbriimonadales bacterium]